MGAGTRRTAATTAAPPRRMVDVSMCFTCQNGVCFEPDTDFSSSGGVVISMMAIFCSAPRSKFLQKVKLYSPNPVPR